jgi:hypothetical protein
MLIKLSEKTPITDNLLDTNKIKIKNTKCIIKTYETTSDNFCTEQLLNFNENLKINVSNVSNVSNGDMQINRHQKYIISTVELDKPSEAKTKYLKYKQKYLKLKKELYSLNNII